MEIEEKKIQAPNNDREIRFLLNANFYSLEEVKETLEKFKEICEGWIGGIEDNQIEVVLKSNDFSDLEILKHEFCNYSLGLMKNNLRV
jgi:hypothetical protein